MFTAHGADTSDDMGLMYVNDGALFFVGANMPRKAFVFWNMRTFSLVLI